VEEECENGRFIHEFQKVDTCELTLAPIGVEVATHKVEVVGDDAKGGVLGLGHGHGGDQDGRNSRSQGKDRGELHF
jgi:hypothetical protein